MAKADNLQLQITKYVERNVTMLGAESSQLIEQVTSLQLSQIPSVQDGCLEKMEGVLKLLINYIGQLKEAALPLIHQILP